MRLEKKERAGEFLTKGKLKKLGKVRKLAKEKEAAEASGDIVAEDAVASGSAVAVAVCESPGGIAEEEQSVKLGESDVERIVELVLARLANSSAETSRSSSKRGRDGAELDDLEGEAPSQSRPRVDFVAPDGSTSVPEESRTSELQECRERLSRAEEDIAKLKRVVVSLMRKKLA